MDPTPQFSLVVPFYNEEKSIPELHARLVEVLEKMGQPYEIIFVDDGSRDGTFSAMRQLKPVRAFRLNRNAGHTKAFGFGVSQARGNVIIGLDGDLENFPEDIPKLLATFHEGYDLVCGWRKNRWQGQFLTRKLPSLLANSLISSVTGLKMHDHGCFLRVYKKELFNRFDFHGESQRMVIPYAFHNGARIAEVAVGYAPRKYGQSKFGLSRTFEVMIDVLTFHFFHRFGDRPRHFFGAFGLMSLGIAFLAFCWMLFLKFAEGISFIITPLPTVIAIFTVVGGQFILMGLLAEIIVREINKDKPLGVEVAEKVENQEV